MNSNLATLNAIGIRSYLGLAPYILPHLLPGCRQQEVIQRPRRDTITLYAHPARKIIPTVKL